MMISAKIQTSALFIFLGLFTFLIYVPSLGNDFVNFDDYALVRDHPIVTEHSFNSIKKAFTSFDPELYIPLTFLSYKVDNIFCGTEPFCYHVTSLVLHVANALLVFWIFLLLLRKKWIAFLCAFLFAIHPINTEAVVWASARKDVLSAFFFLTSLISYLLAHEKNSNRALFIASIILFAFALMAKVSVIVLPFILILFDWHEEGSVKIKRVTEKWPYFALALIFGVIALMGKEHILEALPVTSVLLFIPKSIVFSLQQFILPLNLSAFYHYTGAVTLASPFFFVPCILLLFIISGIAISLIWTRKVALASFFYVILLLPNFATFSKKGELFYFSDRYIYIAQLGLLLLLGWWLLGLRKSSVQMCAAALILVIGFSFSFLTVNQSFAWRDTRTIYEHAVKVRPDIFISQHNLGWVYLGEGRIDEAIIHLKKAIEIDPARPKPHGNLSEAYGRKGMYEEGLKEALKSLELDPEKEAEYKDAVRILEDLQKR
ncbi:MAG: tetratricopeptide repeat protein [Patescibacteria group bacterium]